MDNLQEQADRGRERRQTTDFGEASLVELLQRMIDKLGEPTNTGEMELTIARAAISKQIELLGYAGYYVEKEVAKGDKRPPEKNLYTLTAPAWVRPELVVVGCTNDMTTIQLHNQVVGKAPSTSPETLRVMLDEAYDQSYRERAGVCQQIIGQLGAILARKDVGILVPHAPLSALPDLVSGMEAMRLDDEGCLFKPPEGEP